MANLPEVCLLECLMPPPNYVLDCVVGTTYSLSPGVLLAMLVASTTPRQNEDGFALEERPKEEILHAIHEGARKCVVFCDHHGSFQEPEGLSSHEKLILNSVVKKEGRSNNSCGSLHGKVVVALFKDAKGCYRGRLYVGSKNFTHANYDEFGLVAEFEQIKRGQSDVFTRNLAGYLQYLHDWESTRVKVPDKIRPLRQVLEVLNTRKFKCVVKDAQFHWQGRFLNSELVPSWGALGEAAKQWMAKGAPDHVFIHSPWVRKGALDHLMALCGDKTKIFLRCLDDKQLAICNHPRVKYDIYHGNDGNLEQHHSHAKIYLFKWGKEALLVFGSANFTPDGWGLSGTRYRPNAEVLVAVPGPFAAFKQLADIQEQPVKDRPAAPQTKTAVDKALEYLGSIRIEVDYDGATKELCYSITQTESSATALPNIEIIHELVEDYEEMKSLTVWQGSTLPNQEVRIPWDGKLNYLISPVVRLRDSNTGVEVHVVVDLQLHFFNGREKLKCLAYTASEFVLSLARLMDFQIEGDISPVKRGENDGDRDDDAVSRFVQALRLERYLYRMGKLKHQAPTEFHETMTRVENLLRLKPDDSRINTSPCKDAIAAITKCHKVLHGT